MMPSQILICSGLILDVIGVILVYRYGLPSRYPREAAPNYMSWGTSDEGDDQTRWEYTVGSKSGIGFLVLGFMLQFWGALL